MGAYLALLACSPLQQLQSAAVAGGGIVNSVAAAGESASPSTAELRHLQTKHFQTTKAATFASVMTVLLDMGYRVVSADLESGLITASASTTERLKLDPVGLARSAQTPLASVYIDERDHQSTRVRSVFSLGTSSTGKGASTG